MTIGRVVCGLCGESVFPLYQLKDRHVCLDCFHAFSDLLERYEPWDEALKKSREMKEIRRRVGSEMKTPKLEKPGLSGNA
jgi:hypothetical protein